jgi:hypothetical protein
MHGRWTQLLLAVLGVALIATIAVALLSGDDEVSLTPGVPKVVSVAELEDFADGADHAVYWVGERPDARYELTETATHRVFVRYLPADGGGGGEFLTVGTYPGQDPVGELERAAREGHGKEIARSDEGAVVLIDPESPENAHLAYPGDDVQVEIFSPVPGEALRMASRDRVEPVP